MDNELLFDDKYDSKSKKDYSKHRKNFEKIIEKMNLENNENSETFSLFDDQATYLESQKTNSSHKKHRVNYVNVDSRNRVTKSILNFKKIDDLGTDPLNFFSRNEVVVYHPENKMNINDVNHVIFEGIDGLKICNYPANKIEYDPNTNKPVHLVKKFLDIKETINQLGQTIETSDYYLIELPVVGGSEFIQTGSGGGSNIRAKILKSNTEIYSNTSNYKVKLNKKFSNVVSIRLLSTEIPNVSLTVNSKNNEIRWINKEDGTYICDKVLVSDSVFQDTLNKKNYINNINEINSNPSSLQIEIASNTCSDINNDTEMLAAYKILTDDTITCSPSNSGSDPNNQTDNEIDILYSNNKYYTPFKLFDPEFFLKNSYHKIGKTLKYHLEDLENNQGFTSDDLKQYIPWEYNYSNKDTDVPDYIGYQIFDVGSNSSIRNQFVSLFDSFNDDYIAPSNNIKYSSLIPQSLSNDFTVNFNLTYPINSINLDKAIYNNRTLIDMMTNKMNLANKFKYSWKSRDWYQPKISNKFSQNDYEQYPIFDISTTNGGEIIEFRQFKIRSNYHSLYREILNENGSIGKNNMCVILNAGYPELAIQNHGNNYISGDRIHIKNSKKISNIDKNHIDGNHIIKSYPVYEIHVRLIYPVLDDIYYLPRNSSTMETEANNGISVDSSDSLITITTTSTHGLMDNDQIYITGTGELLDGNDYYIDVISTTTFTLYSDSDLSTIADDLGTTTPTGYSQGTIQPTITYLDAYKINNSNLCEITEGTYKALLDYFGEENLKLLNKGSFSGMLKHVGSKLVNSSLSGTNGAPTGNTNHNTETELLEIKGPESPFSNNELIARFDEINSNDQHFRLGRIIQTDRSDSNGNFTIKYELTTSSSIGNFTIGDFIISMETNCVAMIVPYNWDNSCLPTLTDINDGFETYIDGKISSNSNLVKPDIFDKNWSIRELDNGSKNISIDLNIVPVKSIIEPKNIDDMRICEPIEFSFLYGDTSFKKELGLLSTRKKDTPVDFVEITSNMKKDTEYDIKSSMFLSTHENIENNYLLVETENNADFKVGDIIYIENHVVNPFYKKNNIYENISIKSIYPFKDWLYNLEAEFINNSSDDDATSSVAIQNHIDNIKTWLHVNIDKWTKDDIVFQNYIIQNFYYGSDKVYKIYVEEITGIGLSSGVFLKEMTITNDTKSVTLSDKILGITKIKTTTDNVYNEEMITDITEITTLSGKNKYFIYFEKHTDFDVSENDSISFTDSTGGIVIRSASATIDTFPDNSTLYKDANIDYLYYFYFANKIIVNYHTDHSKQELEYMGNHGIHFEHTNIDSVNSETIPITTISSGQHVYIYNHQKAVPQYFSESDAIGQPHLLETIRNDLDKASCKDMNKKITGIKDGSYRALINLWPGIIGDSLYLDKYKPGKTIVIDKNWTKDIEEGYLNKGKMRIRKKDLEIIGNNLLEGFSSRNYDSYTDDLNDIGSFGYLSSYANEDDTTIEVNDGSVFSVGGIIIIDTIIYSQTEKSPYLSKEKNDITEINIITDISSNTITLKHELINKHLSSCLIIEKYKIAYCDSDITKGDSTINVKDASLFTTGDYIMIDWNSKQSGNYTEQKNIVTDTDNTINTIELKNIVLSSYSTDDYSNNEIPIVIMGSDIKNSCACTQNVLINSEWYTKVFYKGFDCIDIDYDADNNTNTETEYYKEGVPSFTKFSSREVEIIGMKGIKIGQNSLDTTLHDETISDRDFYKDAILDNSYQIDPIKPLLNGTYKIVPDIIQDNTDYMMTKYYDLPIKGSFSKSKDTFSSVNKWDNSLTDDLVYNCVLIKGKYMGYGGKITFKKKKSIINNPDGFKILKKIKFNDNSSKFNKFIIDLKKKDTNIITHNSNLDSTISPINHLVYNHNVPSSVLLENFNTLDTFNLSKNIRIGIGGTMFKKIKDGPISIQGENYINMCFTNLTSIENINTNNIDNIFSKILLSSGKNKILYNTFVPSVKTFYDSPLSYLDELHIKFIDNNNDEVDFRGFEHSFTLEIVELEDKLEYINSRTGNIEY